MVFPRLHAIEALDRGLLGQQRRSGGLIQRGRIVGVDTNYNPPLLSVAVHLRGGNSATIPNVQVVSSVFDPAAIQGPDLTVEQAQDMARPKLSQEVLLLCPTGRAADECYAVGLATAATALVDNTSASVDGFRTVDDGGLKVRFAIPPATIDRRLTVTGLAAKLGPGARVSPRVVIGGETFRSPYSFPLVGVSGERQVTFAGSYSRRVGANRAAVLQMTFSGDGSVPLLPWEYELATTDTAPTSGVLIPETIGNTYPAVAVFGRIG